MKKCALLVLLTAVSAEAVAQNSRPRRRRTPSSAADQMMTPPNARQPRPMTPPANPQTVYPPNAGQPPAYPPPTQLPAYQQPMGQPAPLPQGYPNAYPQPRPRNQNPLGQPADLPPHLRPRDELGGTQNWFGLGGAGYGYDTISRTNPGVAECSEACDKTIVEPRWALQLQGALGWGPIKKNNISFTTHYRYTQNLRTNEDQAGRISQWFKTFKSEDFIFPTRDMLRSHEIVSEIRYSKTPFQFGLHAMLEFERVGSSASFLGAPNEVSDSVRNIEQVVPWFQWRIPGTYIATLYTPMRTEINKEDPRNSFTTWSLQKSGRGLFITAIQDNLFYLPKISSTAGVTFNWTNKKSASIQNDSSRIGAKVSMDFPIAWNIRLQPYMKFDSDSYILQRIKINNITDGSATLVKRTDSIFATGGQAYYDLSRSWRFNFITNFESTQSTLSDFSGSKISFFGGFTYSWPLTRPVLRRLERFTDSLAAEEN